MPSISCQLFHAGCLWISCQLFHATYFMPAVCGFHATYFMPPILCHLFCATYFMPPISCHLFHASCLWISCHLFWATYFMAATYFMLPISCHLSMPAEGPAIPCLDECGKHQMQMWLAHQMNKIRTRYKITPVLDEQDLNIMHMITPHWI